MGRKMLVDGAQPVTLAEALGVGEERRRAADELERWAKRRRSKPPVAEAGLEASLSEASSRMASGEWSGSLPRHFVALWASCHERVYGVTAVGELAGMGWRSAVKLAASLMRDEFGGDADELARFVRWTWVREEGKERWCKQKGYDRKRRVGWRQQFGAELVTEYRLEQARKGER